MVTTNSTIGIIGAGTSGAYLASLLAQEGLQVHLFETAPVARTDGYGILIVQAGIILGRWFGVNPTSKI